MNTLQEERRKSHFESLLRHLLAAFNRMGAVEQDFRFDDGDYTALLAERRITGQCVGIGFEARIRWHTVAYGNHRAPFIELRTKFLILFNSSPKSVESLGHDFAGEAGDIDRSLVDF